MYIIDQNYWLCNFTVSYADEILLISTSVAYKYDLQRAVIHVDC